MKIFNRYYSKFVIGFILLLLSIYISLIPITLDRNIIYESALSNVSNLQNINLKDNSGIDSRNNNFWNKVFLYNKFYNNDITNKSFVDKIPYPKFPFFLVLFNTFTNSTYKIPPINFIDISNYIRRKISSGITIRTKNKSLKVIKLNYIRASDPYLLSFLNKLLIYTKKIDLIRIKSYSSSKLLGQATLSYNNFIKNNTIGLKNSFYNELKKNFNSISVDIIKQKFQSHILNIKDIKNINYSNVLDSEKKVIKEYRFDIKPISNKQITINEVYNKSINYLLQNKYLYTICLDGLYIDKNKEKKNATKHIVVSQNTNIITELVNQSIFNNFLINKVTIYSSKVLRYKPNNRVLVPDSQITDFIRKAFVLLEDDYFYVQFGGFDIIGIIKATYNYIFHNTKKGNASIIEQVYEMHFANKTITPYDKLKQLLASIYLSYYYTDRNKLLDFYIQSIPGSYLQGHNYGIASIANSYLNKTIAELNIREIAWLSRIALLPSVFGVEYIAYHRLIESLKEKNIQLDSKDDNKFKNTLINHTKLSKKNIKKILSLRRSYKLTNTYINSALSKFYNGNIFIKPLINKQQYDDAINSNINFTFNNKHRNINIHQSYTDLTLKEIVQTFGYGATNIGLDCQVAFSEKHQNIVDKELVNSANKNYINSITPKGGTFFKNDKESLDYGGGAILVKLHSIKDRSIANEVIALSSTSTTGKYFNWPVEGQREFGSIFKWLALLLYLDSKGTLLDEYYDIPRKFLYNLKENNSLGVSNKKGVYRPDNWKRRGDAYGFYTFKRHNMLYNFLKSKNGVFVRIVEILGTKNFANFLNVLSNYGLYNNKFYEHNVNSYLQRNKRVDFKPILPLVLGGGASTSSVNMAKMLSVIPNQGIIKDFTTISSIVNYEGVETSLNREEMRIVSKEAAQQAIFCGYFNSYTSGTGRSFIDGGICKTGSSNSDLSFVGISFRDSEYYDDKYEDETLNYNLLYLVNIGADRGILPKGLYGSMIAAPNTTKVFKKILYSSKYKKMLPISNNLDSIFSNKFEFKDTAYYTYRMGKKLIPLLKNREVYLEDELSFEEIDTIKNEYIKFKNDAIVLQLAVELASLSGLDFNKLSLFEKNYFHERAEMELLHRDMGYEINDQQIDFILNSKNKKDTENNKNKDIKDFKDSKDVNNNSKDIKKDTKDEDDSSKDLEDDLIDSILKGVTLPDNMYADSE